MRFKALHVPHCHPFKHGFYLTGAQPAHSFAEQAVRTPARAGMTKPSFWPKVKNQPLPNIT
ncbi:hypothetical protein EGH14_12540 [Neisseria gonorrhoeae]|nr:hypothetical protein EGH14_12540 [Neisseria gonorrhoeae]AZG30831.1 hypothetical protein EGH20_12550 [Neisseria gonorrhoeae]AZG30833.1 hypothetical protein EGH20_12560 [Neisseria gonorrhoeae]